MRSLFIYVPEQIHASFLLHDVDAEEDIFMKSDGFKDSRIRDVFRKSLQTGHVIRLVIMECCGKTSELVLLLFVDLSPIYS